MVGKCLNNAWILQYFEDICDESGGGFPWVTVFKEEKKSNEDFQPVDNDTILVFCMLLEKEYSDFSYLGQFLTQKSMTCQALLTGIVENMTELQEGEVYRAFIGEETAMTKDITHQSSTLDEV